MKIQWKRAFFIGALGILLSSTAFSKVVVAIDAGHGGEDPGALGKHLGVQEKEVTLAIARELKAFLDADPNFKTVMTRNRDTSVALKERTEIARRGRANYLVSIHADSSPNSSDLKGVSVWVLSNKRANDELGEWLEDSEKQSELLGGAGEVLSNNHERYLSHTVLDLQFSHSQRVGYELGKSVLSKLSNVVSLVRKQPQHASLSVLRSPDIPSILVETGFLSNAVEEQRLTNPGYRRQIARAIYEGLVSYTSKTARDNQPKVVYKEAKEEKKSAKTEEPKTSKTESKKAKESAKNSAEKINRGKNTDTSEKSSALKESKTVKNEQKVEKTFDANATHHTVAQDETLYSIARRYNTTPEKLSRLNNIKENKIRTGQKLKLK